MKHLMRALSILIAVAGILVLAGIGLDVDEGFTEVTGHLETVVINNILPLASIAICCYCLERNDSNYLVRVIPICMLVPITLSFFIEVFGVNAEWIIKTYRFLSGTFIGVAVLSITMLVRANNKISTILKYIAVGIIIANVVLSIYAQIKLYLVSTLPNVYGYQNYGGFNFSTLEETSVFIAKAYELTNVGQIFVLILLFMTNFAFSDKIELETEDIDYEAIKQDALNATNMQMQQKYNPQPKQIQIDRSQSEKGLMNVNNQLGQNSNVGNVKEKAKTVNIKGSSLENLIPLSSGPIINNSSSAPSQPQPMPQQQQMQQAPQPQPQPIPQTMPPNLDIQEQMRLRTQQGQNNQNMQ